MEVNQCIFVDRPKECSFCLQSQKLHCLDNHQHLVVSKAGKRELAKILKENCSSPHRYKEKSGQGGRH